MQKYTVHRHWRRYRFWTWTYQNWFWDKYVPEPKTKCGFYQRILWIGAFTLLLHALALPFRILLYSLLYKKLIAQHTNLSDVSASVIIWLVVVGGLYAFGWEWFLPVYTAIACGMLAGLALIVGFVWLINYIFEETAFGDWCGSAIGAVFTVFAKAIYYPVLLPIGKALWFMWQVIARYYTPKYHLPDPKYKLNGGKPQWLIRLGFWLLLIFIFGGTTKGMLAYSGNPTYAKVLLWFLYGELALLVGMWISAYFLNKKWEREELEARTWRMLASSTPRASTALAKTPLKKLPTLWKRFRAWLKDAKLKVCPLTVVVD